ncbi:MAG: LysR family transcriptional regulator [Rubellimicrobium sp.]|nr:LysR family transcriptional regulator [Rubellimicrobium sp.]
MTDLLRRGLKIAHLRLLAGLAESGRIGIAGGRLGLSQPAASRLLSEAEEIAGVALRRRDGRGIALTPEGEALAARARRALSEIALAGRELAEGREGETGHVRLGAVTGAALEVVMPALATARRALPRVSVEVEVGTTAVLTALLRDGTLDFALCRLPEDDPEDFTIAGLRPEPISLVVGRGHPLVGAGPVPATRLLDHDWVLPAPQALLHQAVARAFAARGLPAPRGGLVTASLLLTLGWLAQTDAIAPLATAVARQFVAGGDHALLAEDLGLTVAPYGIVRRRDDTPTPAAARIIALVAGV